MTGSVYSDDKLREYLQWDIMTWHKALIHWDKVLGDTDVSSYEALDLGARDGGLSLYLAEKGMRVVCSDLYGPTAEAFELHGKYNMLGRIEHATINATGIPYDSGRFDLVVFKSVLGGIGTFAGIESIKLALSEMLRVLKPGGILLFAENLDGSKFHKYARRTFVKWGKTWYYPTLMEMKELLGIFDESFIRTYGFFSCIKKDFAPFVLTDRLVCRSNSSKGHYMAYGHAVKSI